MYLQFGLLDPVSISVSVVDIINIFRMTTERESRINYMHLNRVSSSDFVIH